MLAWKHIGSADNKFGCAFCRCSRCLLPSGSVSRSSMLALGRLRAIRSNQNQAIFRSSCQRKSEDQYNSRPDSRPVFVSPGRPQASEANTCSLPLDQLGSSLSFLKTHFNCEILLLLFIFFFSCGLDVAIIRFRDSSWPISQPVSHIAIWIIFNRLDGCDTTMASSTKLSISSSERSEAIPVSVRAL